MTHRPDPHLAKLASLAVLIRDAQILRAGQAATACAVTRARLADLDTSIRAPCANDLIHAQAALRHARWAESRKISLNLQLATQMAAFLTEQDAARTAFGRASVLERLARSGRA